MKIFILALMLTSYQALADSFAKCEMINNTFSNRMLVADLKFETVVDIFTINNAKTLTMTLDGQSLRFLRSKLVVERMTRMTYVSRNHPEEVMSIEVELDRTPREALLSKQFYGNMVIMSERHHFYCRF